MPYVIDDTNFIGADAGLTLPTRRLTDGSMSLRLANLDRSDPPLPYHPGGVPREAAFNRNVVRLPRAGGMPKIPIVCEVGGFDPSTTPIRWRLQVLHALGRYKMKTVTKKGPNKKHIRVHHARALVVSLRDEWQGTINQPKYDLFSQSTDHADHVAGGHAILSIAARPQGASGWLQDYVHLRIIGTNPGAPDVRTEVKRMASGRHDNLIPMLNAIFAWEASFRQFRPSSMKGIEEFGLDWEWPNDPAWYPEAAFDFGVGISQYTHPDKLTASIAWDWRDNMRAGANVFLDFLKGTYEPGITWLDWATAAWSGYNGSPAYGAARKNSPDGRLVPDEAVPKNFKVGLFVQPFALVTPPASPVWPVPSVADMHSLPATDARLAQKVGLALASKIADPDVLSWAWPHVERQVLHHDLKSGSGLPPGLTRDLVNEITTTRSTTDVHGLLADALHNAIATTTTGSTRKGADYAGEWKMLSACVHKYVDGGYPSYPSVRDRLFRAFDAMDNVETAISRINAYYALMVAAEFPKPRFDTPMHPELKRRVDAAADLLAQRGAASALNAIEGAGGVDIRNNVNSPSALSNHSFGWAVDFDAPLNPNIKKAVIPLSVISAFTGVDLYGADSNALRTPGAYDAMLPSARTLAEASHAFRVAMSSSIELHAAMGPALSRVTKLQVTSAQVDEVFALVTASKPNKAGISSLLKGAGATTSAAASAATILIAAASLAAKAARVTKPTIIGSAASIARFGFVNLAPEFIAALISSQGGGLRWLGAATGTKDFMHFELFTADEPARY